MTLHLERYGSGERVLFIHGAGGSANVWHFQKEGLKALMEVMLIDLPGHGRSPGPACKGIEETRDVLLNFMKERNLFPCYVAGHSMGGAVAMSLALSEPGGLDGIILIGTGARLRVLPDILTGIMEDKEKTVRRIVDLAFSPRAPLPMKEGGVAEMMKSGQDVIYNNFLACDHFDVVKSVGTIKVPAAVICGADDVMTPPSYSRFLAREIGGGSPAIIEGAGHMVMLEKPDEVNRIIAAFVNREHVDG